MLKIFLALGIASLLPVVAASQTPAKPTYHLAAHPWKPEAVPRERYLDAIEGICRFSARQQNQEGAIIDPFLHHEHQYATPYYAYAVATLVSAGRAADLLPSGVRAMEHSTKCFSEGRDAIPDQHGEFFIASLTESLKLFQGLVPQDQWRVWQDRLRRPSAEIIRGSIGNWETYRMKGDWLRAQAGLISRQDAIQVIEQAWDTHQRQRFSNDDLRLYHDRSSDPDTLSVEAVGRGNLLALIELGYDGPSAAEIRKLVEAGTRTTLLLQDPSGQVPANGRTDDHVWVDAGYQLGFEVMAERLKEADPWLAGQYRHAALLSFESISRWRRSDPPWDGSYFVTKNHFDPALRVGYQDASQYSNYNGSLMFHLSEAYHARASRIEEHPSPSEIGGYTVRTDDQFASVLADAGGMQMQANLRGDPGPSSGNFWTPAGVVRFARTGWDTRLGPSDGALTAAGGLSFAPTFFVSPRWVQIADIAAGYRGEWSQEFTHPALIRCRIVYRPDSSHQGPQFENTFVITPDGILSELRKISPEPVEWGATWPLLKNDGQPLSIIGAKGIATTAFPGRSDSENFIALNQDAHLDDSGNPLRSTYGDLLPVRMTTKEPVSRTFIYPRTAADPPADAVRQSFRVTAKGFESVLGRVEGNVYVGKTAAGGVGSSVDLNGNGTPDVKFSSSCGFVVQIAHGKVITAESDREVRAVIQGKSVLLLPYTPVVLN